MHLSIFLENIMKTQEDILGENLQDLELQSDVDMQELENNKN